MTNTTTTARDILDAPAIWAGCLAAYNAGTLHGRWIAATSDADEMREQIAEMLATSPAAGAEEFEIMDYNAIPGHVRGLDQVAAYMELLEEVQDELSVDDEDAAEIIAAFFNWQGELPTASKLQDAYIGKFDSVKDWVEEFASDTDLLEGMPDHLRPYFDWDAYARDVELNGDVYRDDSTGRMFWGNN